MSEYLVGFERDVSRLDCLFWSIRYIKEHQSEFTESLTHDVTKQRATLPARDYESLVSDTLSFVAVAENILLWMFYEKYIRAIHQRHDGTEDVKRRCPSYLLKCHRNHDGSHVLDIVRDFRDRSVHDLEEYNNIECDRPPEETLLQTVAVYRFDHGEEILLMHGLNSDRQLTLMKRKKLPVRHVSLMTFGELLTSKLVSCVREYDRRFSQRKGM